MMEQTNLVPKRRFREFQHAEAWEQREYGEVINLLSGQDFSPSEYNDTCNGIPYMTGASCIVGKETIVNRWTTVPRCLAEKGDVLLVCKGSGYGAITVLAQEKAHIARQFMALKNLPNLDKVFNFYLLNSVIENIKKDARGLIAGIARDAVIKQEISIPSLEEQSQIGVFFKKIDNLITLNQRKLDKTKALKSAYLSEMFPAEGESEPKRRFAGFTGTWEQRKVGELTNVVSAARVHKEEWASSGIPFFRSSDVVSAYKSKENGKAFISFELYEQLARVSGKLEKDDILITGGGSIGIPYIVPNNEPLYSKDADLIWVKNSGKFNSQYLYFYFTSPEFRRYLSGISHIGTIAHYTIEQVKETPIYLPSIDEQNEIGSFFRSIDNLITLHQRKLEKLQNIKKAYLNEMFL